jgi:AcrR family transcriptional regulator
MATRERILAAAASLFAAHGFDGTSVRMIAEEAGANQAAINYYFHSKDNLYHEILKSEVIGMRGVIVKASELAAPFPERLRVFCHELVHRMWERRALVRMVADSLLHGGERLPQAVLQEMPQNVAALVSFLDAGLKEYSEGGSDPRMAAAALVGPVIHLTLFGEQIGPMAGMDLSDKGARESLADLHWRFLCRGLLGEDPCKEKA